MRNQTRLWGERLRVFALITVLPLCALVVFAGGGTKSRPAPVKKLDFLRDIRPILAEKCFKCHGSDPDSRQASLRLDLRETATGELPNGDRAIVPGKPDESKLVKRIFDDDELFQMPPPSSQKTLTAEQKQTLKQWIAQGAEYKPHWAFVTPKRPALPAVQNKQWPKGSIDRFVLAAMEKAGLKPSPQASRNTLIRRVTLDLLGVLPTPEEVTAFLADRSPNAYEKVVDRLLASPAYGERMALAWLDGARYADSNGYQADWERFQWRWRDWVIEAFNNNMPFDQFTIEQLAGDLLPNPTQAQRIATGFNRNHRINTEGGVIAEEWRVENCVDRVETTSSVWLGLTAGCARCHAHKYDPISSKEFYGLFAYFNSIAESGTGEERPVNHPPIMKAPTDAQAVRQAELSASLKDLDGRLETRLASNAASADGWSLADLKDDEAPLLSGVVARYALSAKPALAAGNAPAPMVEGKVAADPGNATGAAVTGDEGYIDLGNVADFEKGGPFSYGAWVNPANSNNGAPLSRMDSGNDYRGWDLYLSGNRPMIHLIHKWPVNALKIVSRMTIPVNQWSHVFVTYDGTAKPDGLKLYVNGAPVAFDVEVNSLTDTMRTPVSAKIGARTGTDRFAGKVDDPVIYGRVLAADEVNRLAAYGPLRKLLALEPAQRTEAQRKQVVRYWSDRHDEAYRATAKERDEKAAAASTLDGEIPTVMVMEELPQPRDCFQLIRGQYDKHGDKVLPGIPAAFPPLPKGAPNNRLGLAMWIVDPANPLTARVQVNRFWEKFFGTGLVSTTEDFGTRADFPTHPELLDWLATEFIRLQWDMKALQKEIVMSATYRQSSDVPTAAMKIDPVNRLLSHAPRFRLQAEVVRDQVLSACGLLVDKIGGPSVRPYMPKAVWDETGAFGNLNNYKSDLGDGLYRKSMYTIWKRTAAPPSMMLFDAPSRELCRIRRSRTNTPLQALALMNEETYVEAARTLAQKMIQAGGADPATRIDYAFLRMLSRRATPQEQKVLQPGLRKMLAHYRFYRDDAKKLLAVGASPADPHLDEAELAAYTMIASAVINLDETITKD